MYNLKVTLLYTDNGYIEEEELDDFLKEFISTVVPEELGIKV